MKMDIRDCGLMVFGGIIVLILAFTAWHPNNNDYVSREDYNQLYQDYITLQQENEALKEDMGQLILEYYGKTFALNSLGLKKYKITICALQKYLIGEIPLINEMC